MRKNTLMKVLFTFIALLPLTVFGQFGASLKGPEKTSYYQFPSVGLKYSKVEAFIVLDQSKDRAAVNKMGSKLGKMGGFGKVMQAGASAVAKVAIKDITEVWDTWYLKPKYIRASEGNAGKLKLEVTYRPDDSSRPMTKPSAGSSGYYNISYKVTASMKVTDESGKVIMKKNYGILTGNAKTNLAYKEQAQTKNGLGTYEMVCIRAAMNKARQDIFGLYGFGLMNAKLQLGHIKQIKATKKLVKSVLEALEVKKSFILDEQTKGKIKDLVAAIEPNISSCTAKNKWIAYHNLAVCYAWLEDTNKAKMYLDKYYQEGKTSFDKITNFGKGSRSYNLKDIKKYEGYCNIESFVKNYPVGAVKYPELLNALNRPLKKFVDFYTHNDLLGQIYGIDFPFQFFPLNDFKGMPKGMKGELVKEGSKPITFYAKCDSKRRIKEEQVNQVVIKKGKEKDLKTRQMQPIYNKKGDFLMISNPNSRFGGTSKAELRRFGSPLEDQTLGKAKNILKAGMFGTANETVNLQFDLKGTMYFSGKNYFSSSFSLFKDILDASNIQLKSSSTSSKFDAEAKINEHGVITNLKWVGDVAMRSGAGSGAGCDIMNSGNASMSAKNLVRQFKVVSFDDKGYPSKIEYSIKADSKMKMYAKASLKGWWEATKKWQTYSVKSNSVAKGINIKNVWDCKYKYDAKGNWIEMKVGPYTAKRTFKY